MLVIEKDRDFTGRRGAEIRACHLSGCRRERRTREADDPERESRHHGESSRNESFH
jgi:hypothetical protein